MERIVIEVDDATAKKWQAVSPKIRQRLEKNIKRQMARKSFETAVKKGEVCSSDKTYNELSEVLLRSKFDTYISSEEKLLALMQSKELAVLIEISETITDCRGPKDNKFLELAVSANASCITGDKDLLILNPFR